VRAGRSKLPLARTVRMMHKQLEQNLRALLALAAITLLGLGLRLLTWQWREFYPLGGDEQEYLAVALTLLQEQRYTELLFMRPPLYPLFLAASIYAVDSLVQNLRLVQALISTATIPLVYLLTRELTSLFQSTVRSPQFDSPEPHRSSIGYRLSAIGYRAPLLAALLTALSYTLAVNATELLSETLFLFSLTASLWLIVRAGRLGGRWRIALAGLALGASCLIRSVALPLLPLAAIWLFTNVKGKRQNAKWQLRPALIQCCIFTFAFCILVLPWTARNYVTYGGVILIDTTGAENLWLDNDPAGREAVKAQLFALGEDRLARQQLASQRGVAVITADPARFFAKMGTELKLLFALEYTDDMRARPAIWVPPAEVAARLILGDGLWLLIMLVGSYGLAYAALSGGPPGRAALLLFLPWCAYIALTSMIFHVELRYRLPVFPALLPFAALVLTKAHNTSANYADDAENVRSVVRRPSSVVRGRALIAALLPALCLLITLLHVNYPALAWQLGNKHVQLARAERALTRGDAATAQAAAQAALEADPDRALAHVALARTALLRDDYATAETELATAIANIPAHPHAHLLFGDLHRAAGDMGAARAALTAYETGSLQDLQSWLWERRVTPASAQLTLGDGLDLGFVRGFHPVGASETGFRWARERAAVALYVPPGATTLVLTADARRPDQSGVPVQVWLNGEQAGDVVIATGVDEYRLPLPTDVTGMPATIELRSPTFTPRAFDPASPDGRRLGIAVSAIGVE
jgi:tetratricopeptide (TPR) repeat protein